MCLSESPVFGQDKIDIVEVKKFWRQSVLPFIQKDTKTVDKIVHFPLGGDWGYLMELNKEQKDWTKQDFIENYGKLFTPSLIAKLKAMDYKDVDVCTDENGITELLVSVGQEQWIDGFKDESAVILRFKKLKGNWKLYLIQAAG